jgi:hypothetical protein
MDMGMREQVGGKEQLPEVSFGAGRLAYGHALLWTCWMGRALRARDN